MINCFSNKDISAPALAAHGEAVASCARFCSTMVQQRVALPEQIDVLGALQQRLEHIQRALPSHWDAYGHSGPHKRHVPLIAVQHGLDGLGCVDFVPGAVFAQ